AAALAQAVFKGRWLAGQGEGIGPLVLSQTRTSITFLLLLPLLAASRALGVRQAALFPRSRALFGAILIGAAGISASNFLYYFSIQKTTVATAIILQYLCPIWVLIYMAARGFQRATASRIAGVLLAVGGCALAVGQAGVQYSLAGLGAGLAASFAFAFFNVGGQRLVAEADRWSIFLGAMLGSAVFWAVANPPWRLIATRYSAAQWEFLVLFAVFSMLLPYGMYLSGLKYLDATRAVVTACLEPVFAIALAVVTAGESISIWQAAGVACVLAGTIVVQRT
ncbi:MAG: EamA family transporter, partial [Acidobacteria bacterium]|nr:EamA family transporter [Acidobacteriota bacterium]